VTDNKSRRVETTFTIHATASAFDFCAPPAKGVANVTATADNSTATTVEQNFTMTEVMKRLSYLFKSGLVFDENSPEFA